MSMKVLIADHDWRFAGQVSTYLESRAHHAVHHTHAKDALAQAAHWQPDLVILSADMAEAMMEPLKTMQPRPAILLTGRMDRFDKAWRAWQTGGDELLMKPVLRAGELQDAIVTAMENAATGARPQRLARSA